MGDIRALNRLWRRCVAALAGLLWLGGAQAQNLPLPPITLDYFGLVLSRDDATMPWPSVPFGSWRLWDAHVTWALLEPEPGRWNFQLLDRLVDEATAHRTQLLLVLAHSPAWASARPTEASAYKPGYAAEPQRIEDWRNYIRTVVQRYRGRIEGYQIWNEPSDKTHYTGSIPQLVELTCEAQKIIKSIDPAAKVVSAGSAGGGRHVQYLDDFLRLGADRCIDVVAHHFYVPRFGPEQMLPMIRQVREVMRSRKVDHLPLWNTETGWWIANTDGQPDHPIVANGGWRKLDADTEAGATLQRVFLLSRAEGVERLYWYSWVNAYGWGLADNQAKPKPAARYWNTLVNTLLGETVQACSTRGGQIGCTLNNAAGQRRDIAWDIGNALQRHDGPASGQGAVGGVPFAPAKP